MTVYYPSCVASLKIRFDETLQVLETPDPVAVGDVRAAVSTTPRLRPLVADTTKNLSYALDFVPQRASFDRSGYQEAGQFTLVFEWDDLPIDPRMLRACSVEIYLDTVKPEDFARGIRGDKSSGGRLLSRVAGRNDAGLPGEALAFVGLVDEVDQETGDNGTSITLTGRDLRSLFIDVPLFDKAVQEIDFGQTIKDVVEQIVKLHPRGESFGEVQIDLSDWPSGLPLVATSSNRPRHRLPARGKKKSRVRHGKASQMSFWDLIVKTCSMVGAVPYFSGYSLWIRPMRSIFKQLAGEASPFRGDRPRTIDGEEIKVRRLVIGRGIEELRLKRKLQSELGKPKVIRCVSTIDAPKRGEPSFIEARWPEKDTPPSARRTSVSPSGSLAQEDFTNVSIPGVKDVARLKEIARAIFEGNGKRELTGSVKTHALASFGGNNDDPDLLRITPGDAIELMAATGPGRERIGLAQLMSTTTSYRDQVEQVRAAVGDENFARAIVSTYRGNTLQLQRFFRVSGVHIDWQNKTGVEISIDFQNYVTALYDQRGAAGVAT